MAPEFLRCWQGVTSKYDMHEHIKFEHRCTEARWDRRESKWTAKLARPTGDDAPEVVEDNADGLKSQADIRRDSSAPIEP